MNNGPRNTLKTIKHIIYFKIFFIVLILFSAYVITHYIYIYIYIHIYIYIIYRYIHTYIYIYIHICIYMHMYNIYNVCILIKFDGDKTNSRTIYNSNFYFLTSARYATIYLSKITTTK